LLVPTSVDLGEMTPVELEFLCDSFRAAGEVCRSTFGREHLARMCVQWVQIISQEQERRANSPVQNATVRVLLELEAKTGGEVAAAIFALGVSMKLMKGVVPSAGRCAEVCERVAAEIRAKFAAPAGEVN